MPRQSVDSHSYLMNSAAKDDVLQTTASNVYNLSALLANDPGSAHFVGFGTNGAQTIPGLSFNLIAGTFTIDASLFTGTSFTYTIQMANGTFSQATVNLLTHESGELLHNWSFEADTVTGDYQTFGSVTGWNTVTGSAALEVVTAGYGGIFGDGHWLDTQASTGPIHISQITDVVTGAHADLAITVSLEQFPPAYLTDSAEVLHIKWNGTEVLAITYADLLAKAGATDAFYTYHVDVIGQAGADTVDISSTGANTNVGYALDSVSLHEFIV